MVRLQKLRNVRIKVAYVVWWQLPLEALSVWNFIFVFQYTLLTAFSAGVSGLFIRRRYVCFSWFLVDLSLGHAVRHSVCLFPITLASCPSFSCSTFLCFSLILTFYNVSPIMPSPTQNRDLSLAPNCLLIILVSSSHMLIFFSESAALRVTAHAASSPF